MLSMVKKNGVTFRFTKDSLAEWQAFENVIAENEV